MDDYYQRRLVDVANGRLDNVLTSRSMVNEKNISKSDINRSFKDYLKTYFVRREDWATSYLDDLPVRGNYTNNYCEAAVRVLEGSDEQCDFLTLHFRVIKKFWNLKYSN